MNTSKLKTEIQIEVTLFIFPSVRNLPQVAKLRDRTDEPFPDLSVRIGDDARVVALVGRRQLGDLEGERLVPDPVLRRPLLEGQPVLEPRDAGPRAAAGRALQAHLKLRMGILSTRGRCFDLSH